MAALPIEATLDSMESALAALEGALHPVLPGLPALAAAQDAVGAARLHACLASAAAVLLAAHLRLSGVDTGAHAIAQEFASLQRLGARVKQAAAVAQGEAAAAGAAAAALAAARGGRAAAAGAGGGGGGALTEEAEEEAEEAAAAAAAAASAEAAAAAAAAGGGRGGGVGQPRYQPSTALNIPASKRVLAAAIGKARGAQ
jgi:hypothetical protein